MKRWLRFVWGLQLINRPLTTLARSGIRLTGLTLPEAIRLPPRSGPIKATLPNGRTLRLWSSGDDVVATSVFWLGWNGPDREALDALYTRASSAAVIVDVGAHVGVFSLVAALANPSATVFAFEPHERARRRMERNLVLSGVRNVKLSPYAAGEQNGPAVFFYVEDALPSNSSLAGESMDSEAGLSQTTVEVVVLDHFLAASGIERVDLVKIDTESTEPAVLRGMREVLDRDRPDIICEVLPGHGVEDELDAILRPLGYRYYHLCPEGEVAVDRIVGSRPYRNYLFSVQ